MSHENRINPEQTQPDELSDAELDSVSGGGGVVEDRPERASVERSNLQVDVGEFIPPFKSR